MRFFIINIMYDMNVIGFLGRVSVYSLYDHFIIVILIAIIVIIGSVVVFNAAFIHGFLYFHCTDFVSNEDVYPAADRHTEVTVLSI